MVNLISTYVVTMLAYGCNKNILNDLHAVLTLEEILF